MPEIDNTVTDEEKQELHEVIDAIGTDLGRLRRKFAFALRCDEIDINLEVRWDVVDVNTCAEDGVPTYCGTTLTHGKIVLAHHDDGIDSWKLRPPEESSYGHKA